MNKELRLIRLDQLEIMSEKGGELVFNPDVEEYVVQVLKTYDQLGEYVDRMKTAIEQTGKTIHPNFKGVIGDQVRCVYRKYGPKYRVTGTHKELEPFLEVQTKVTVDTKKVDDYLKEVGELPAGIEKNKRKPQLSISLKDEEN